MFLVYAHAYFSCRPIYAHDTPPRVQHFSAFHYTIKHSAASQKRESFVLPSHGLSPADENIETHCTTIYRTITFLQYKLSIIILLYMYMGLTWMKSGCGSVHTAQTVCYSDRNCVGAMNLKTNFVKITQFWGVIAMFILYNIASITNLNFECIN